MAATKKQGTFGGKSNALGMGGRAAQLKAQGVPAGVIGSIARSKGAAPGGPNFHRGGKGDDLSYKPRMTDPVSGQKMQRGKPVDPANSTPPPSLPRIDYSKAKTVKPVERIKQGGAFSPSVAKADIGRVKDPQGGSPMKKGEPVQAAYDSSANSKLSLGLKTAGEALKAGFKPDAGSKGDALFSKKAPPKGRRR